VAFQLQIVFNMVASVKFNDKLKDAININILATKRVLALTKQMKMFKAFVHVSTFYSQFHREHVGENVLQGPINCEKLLHMNECLDTTDLELLKPSILQAMPNTYTFTKRLVEELVESELKSAPSGIFRPPILLSTYEEPFPGWIDNLYGPMAFGIGVARGLIHCAYSDNKKQANIMPVDCCINALVAVAWDVSRKRRSTESPVYNYLYENPTWGEHLSMLKYGMHEPLDQPIWHDSCYTIRSRLLYQVAFFVLHMIPGYLLDLLAMAKGQKPQFVKGYQRLNRMVDYVGFFALGNWSYDNKNLVALTKELKANGESGELEFDGSKIDWVKYYRSYVPGVKRYYFKESFDNLDQLRNRYKM
jgi:alcohol-forming fatty acyl-CoA reductase